MVKHWEWRAYGIWFMCLTWTDLGTLELLETGEILTNILMLPYMGPDIHSSFLYRNTQLNTTPTLDSIDQALFEKVKRVVKCYAVPFPTVISGKITFNN